MNQRPMRKPFFKYWKRSRVLRSFYAAAPQKKSQWIPWGKKGRWLRLEEEKESSDTLKYFAAQLKVAAQLMEKRRKFLYDFIKRGWR